MKKMCLGVIALVIASQAGVCMAGVNVDINLGVPAPPRVVVAQAPTYSPPPETFNPVIMIKGLLLEWPFFGLEISVVI